MQTFYDIAYPIESQQQASIESLMITYDGTTPIEALPTFVNLKHLDLTLIKPLPDDELLGKLISLEKLTLHCSYANLNNIKVICTLTKLTHLALYSISNPAFQIPEEISNLSKLIQFTLYDVNIQTLPPQVGQLTALEELYITYCKRLEYLPEEVYALPNLAMLVLQNTSIQYLSNRISQLTKLQQLDVEGSQISELPEELVAIPSCKLIFDNSPAHEKMGNNRAKKYAHFMQKLQTEVADIEKRKAFFNLYTGSHHRVKAQNKPQFVLEAMNFGESDLRVSAVAYWYTENPSPFPAQQEMVLHLTPPKDFKLDWEGVTPLLQENRITISSRMNKEVTHLVVGSSIVGNSLEKALKMQIPIVSYGHFFDYLRHLDNSAYLDKQDEDTHLMAENLLNLLRSDDDSNVDLGLQMALGGGLNDLYVYEIILLYIWAYQQNARFKLVEKILEKHLPIDAFLHLKTMRQLQRYASENDIARYLENIATNRYIEAGKLGRAFFEKYQTGKQYCLSQKESFLWYCNQYRKNSVLRLNNCELVKLPDAIGELKGIKILYLRENKLQNLPTAITNLTQLDTLSLSTNEIQSFPIILTDMPKLASLDISNNQLTELPAEIGKMQALTTLNLHGNKISKLPDEIYNLPALRYLEIGNQNPIFKKRKQIQEKMPYCKVT